MRVKQSVVILALGILLLSGLFVNSIMTQDEPLQVFKDSTTGALLTYPPRVILRPISEQDKRDKIILRAGPSEMEKEQFLITMRYEDNLRIASRLAKQEPIELVLNGSQKALPERFPNFKQVSQREFTQAGKVAAEITFDYSGPTKEIIRQRMLILMRSDDMAVYLAGQTRQADFKELQEDFDQIFNSLRFE